MGTEMKDEALRLADALEKYWGSESGHDRERQAAAELRRLHAQRQMLVEALKDLCTSHARFSGGVWDKARAAIKTVEEGA